MRNCKSIGPVRRRLLVTVMTDQRMNGGWCIREGRALSCMAVKELETLTTVPSMAVFDLHAWLKTLPDGLSKYYPNFKAMGIDGPTLWTADIDEMLT